KAAEVAKMNHAFVKTQEKVLEAHRVHAEITGKTERLKSELAQSEGVSTRLKQSVESLEDERKGLLLENNTHRLAVHKAQGAMSTLVEQNITLKTQLHEADFKMRQHALQIDAQLEQRQAELVRLRGAKSSATEVLASSERERAVWERKYTEISDKYQRLNKE